MPRILPAVLVASALVLNNLSAAAAAAPDPVPTAKTVAAKHNRAALPPGRAAGIKQAQGLQPDRYWLGAGLVIGAFVVAFLLAGIHEDSDEATTTTRP